MSPPRALTHPLVLAGKAWRRCRRAASEFAWRVRLAYRFRQCAGRPDRDVRYRRLGFEELRRLAEFRGGVLAADISRLLREDPRHNTAFQQWWFARAAAAGRGVEALGVDLPEVVRRITLPIKTMALDLNRAFPPGTYDAILCREVFEHVSDADAFLARCAGIAHRGTVLLPSCPYTARQFDGNAFHLRVLSAAELRQAVERHGFLVRDLFREHESHVIVAERGGPR